MNYIITRLNKFIEIGSQAIDQSGRFTVALAGGSTPKSLYKLLTTDEISETKLTGEKFFFFRRRAKCVAPDDDRKQLPNGE